MKVKIDFGNGVYLQPDDRRLTPYHKSIIDSKPIPHTRNGHVITLECGHRANAFGNLENAGGIVLCTACQDKAGRRNPVS